MLILNSFSYIFYKLKKSVWIESRDNKIFIVFFSLIHSQRANRFKMIDVFSIMKTFLHLKFFLDPYSKPASRVYACLCKSILQACDNIFEE